MCNSSFWYLLIYMPQGQQGHRTAFLPAVLGIEFMVSHMRLVLYQLSYILSHKSYICSPKFCEHPLTRLKSMAVFVTRKHVYPF